MRTSASANLTIRRAGWIAVLAIASTGSSLVFACATPFDRPYSSELDR
jgi:hypothetical protein